MTFSKVGERISIEALRIHDRMLHPLINFDGLQNRRYTIRISGVPGKLMKGEILLDWGALRSFKAYNKTRNFIQNNKNLSQIQDPGLTAKGFKIREGKILYRIIKKDKVIFDTIYVKGNTATIVGSVSTGYILMGEDNSITFGLKLTGTLGNPKVETSAAKEILSLPFDLIKRTLQSPAHIINTEKKKKKIKVPVIEEVTIPRNKVAP